MPKNIRVLITLLQCSSEGIHFASRLQELNLSKCIEEREAIKWNVNTEPALNTEPAFAELFS